MRAFVASVLSLSAVLTLGSPPLGAPASGPGLGYDQVMKFHASQQSSDAPPAPGSFQADFSAASAPPQNSGHGMFGKMIAAAQNMGNMFKVGTAERHYYGTTKFRTDNLAMATGDITDCTARTLTHLDLNAKTYHVTSLDQPQTSSGSGGGRSSAPGPTPTDDGTRIAIDISTRAIGPMTIEGIPTSGYAMDMKMTITKADGQTATSNEAVTAYFAAMSEPHTGCPESMMAMPQGPGGAGRGGPSMAQMMLAMQAISGKGDSRFKVTSSGPPLPAGKLAMWELLSMKGDTGNGGFSVETERGDVHPLSDGDPAFSPPPDFTKV